MVPTLHVYHTEISHQKVIWFLSFILQSLLESLEKESFTRMWVRQPNWFVTRAALRTQRSRGPGRTLKTKRSVSARTRRSVHTAWQRYVLTWRVEALLKSRRSRQKLGRCTLVKWWTGWVETLHTFRCRAKVSFFFGNLRIIRIVHNLLCRSEKEVKKYNIVAWQRLTIQSIIERTITCFDVICCGLRINSLDVTWRPLIKLAWKVRLIWSSYKWL